MGAKGGRPPASQEPQAAKHISVQSSAYGGVVPLVYGTRRVAGNIIWLGYFKAHKQTTSGSAPKGGGVSQVQFTYSVSVILCLGEGIMPGDDSIITDNDWWLDLGAAYAGSAQVIAHGPEEQTVQTGLVLPHGVWDVKKVRYAGDETPRGFGRVGAGAGFTGFSHHVIGDREDAETFIKPPSAAPSVAFSHPQSDDPSLVPLYPGFALLEGQNINLRSNASVPNFNMAYAGLEQMVHRRGGGLPGCLPADIVYDFLTNPKHGAGIPVEVLSAGWRNSSLRNSWAAYCRANAIVLNALYDTAVPASAMLEEIAAITNTAVVFTEGRLKLKPYGDQAYAATIPVPVTYDPTTGDDPDGASTVNIADLGEVDFWPGNDAPPVLVETTDSRNVYNTFRVEFLNARNAYSAEIAEAKDDAHIAAFGPRIADSASYHSIVNFWTGGELPAGAPGQNLARDTAQRMLQRNTAGRNKYTFKLPWRYVLLEPMDVVTLTEPILGFDHLPVRIISVEEDTEGKLTIEAEDFLAGVHESAVYQHQPGSGVSTDYNAPAGSTLDVLIFEPQAPLVNQGELWIAARGDPATWGGALVFLSDDDEDYELVGTVHASEIGVVTSSSMGPSVKGDDITSAITFLLHGADGLVSQTPAQAAALKEAVYIGHGNKFEIVGVSDATLVSTLENGDAHVYTLKNYIRRGGYGTDMPGHAAGERVLLLGENVVRVPIPTRMLRRQVFLKFVSFNAYGGGEQSIEDVEPAHFFAEGRWFLRSLPDVANLQMRFIDGYGALAWDRVSDPRNGIVYEVRVGVGSWDTARRLGTTSETTWPIHQVGTYHVRARLDLALESSTLTAYSPNEATLLVAGAITPRNTVLFFDDALAKFPGLMRPYSDAVLNEAPLAYYQLGDRMGDGTFPDFIGSLPPLTIAGTAALTSGIVVGDNAAAIEFTSGGVASDDFGEGAGEDGAGVGGAGGGA